MSQAAGWYRDPFHRGQERYWDGSIWTQGTRPEGAVDAAAPTEDPYGAGSGTDLPSATSFGQSSMQSAPPQPVAEPSFAPLGASAAPVAGAPGQTGGPGAWAPPIAGASVAPAGPHHDKRSGSARKVMYGVAAAALVLVAGGVSTAVLLGGSGDASAQEAVSNAATQTMNAQSADMSVSIDVTAGSLHESIDGNGAFDFAKKTGTMTMTMPVGGSQYSVQEILDGSTVYVNVGGLSTGLAPSKPWMSENVVDGGDSSFGTMDPTSMLQQLQSQGASVSSLGQTTYDGTSVNEYQATLAASALENSIGKLPVSLQQVSSGLSLPNITLDVYVTQDDLLKAIEMPSFSYTVAGQTISMGTTMSLSNYGTPVNVTPPPADEVQPLPQLGGGLGISGSTGTTGSTGSTGNSGASL